MYNFWLFKILINGMMIPILDYIHSLTGSYGLAIIVLTIVIRGAIFPLSMKQYSNMKAMQVLQPRMKELQAQYKDNPQELNKAMMAFYQEHKVNPLGGCLPLLIQSPFLFALYGALYSKDFIDKVNHQGFLFIHDLTVRGLTTPHAVPFWSGIHWDNAAMVAFFGITTFFTQKLAMADPNDAMQRQMLYTMPLMITAMFVFFPLPSGVLLYTVISNLFTLGQYMLIQRMYPKNALVPAKDQVIDVEAQTIRDAGKSKKGN